MVTDLGELAGFDENDPVYDQLAFENSRRLYGFLLSMVDVAVKTNRRMISQHLIRAFNHHAIVGLHYTAGRYRSHPEEIRDSSGAVVYTAPEAHRLPALMDEFVNYANSSWSSKQPVELAAYVLWAICAIHPFINGNGRTARAAAYYVLCAKVGGPLPGARTLPDLLRDPEVRPLYYSALRDADAGNLRPLVDLLTTQLLRQVLTTE